jgi:hypothetical protein
MKTALVLVVILASGVAAADPVDTAYLAYHPRETGMWLDLGAMWERVNPGNGEGYAGKLVHFAPHVMLNQTFYLGGEVEVGTITGTSQSVLARGDGGAMQPVDPAVHGSLAAIKAVVGMRARAGMITGGAELAAGIRHASLEDAMNVQLTGVADKGIVEAHGRLDLWVSRAISIGAIAGVDVFDATNVMVGLDLGLHYEP